MPAYAYKPWVEEIFLRREQAARGRAYQPLATIAIAFGVGVALDRSAPLGVGWWAAAAVAWVGWIVFWRLGRQRVAAAVLLVSVGSTGAAWHHGAWRLFDSDEVGRCAEQESQPVCLEAVAIDGPHRRPEPEFTPLRAIPQGESTELALRITRLREGKTWRRATGEVQLIVDGRLLGVQHGDRLRVFGQLRAAGRPMNPGQFDFAADARSERRLAGVRCESSACVSLLKEGGPWSLWRGMTGARLRVEDILNHRLGPERGQLAAAMLVGARGGVSRDRAEPFRRTGTLHVLVVSGLHVGLVVGVFFVAARVGWFPRWPTMLAVMVLIAGYSMVTGARPPVIRATVLAEMMCVATLVGRRPLALNSLAAATLVVLGMNPSELFRAGAQLSFLAAATLLAFANWELRRRKDDAMTRLLKSARPWHARLARGAVGWAWLLILASLAIWIAAAPLLALRFHLLSPIAVPLSVAVFPLVTLSVLSALLLVLCEFLAPPLAPLIATASGWSVGGLDAVVGAADGAHLGRFWLAGPSGWWVLGAYLLMGAGLLWGGRPRAPKRLLWGALVWLMAGALAPLGSSGSGESMRCTFIAVGHGCSVLVETPGGETLLYDAGSLGSPQTTTDAIARVLWSKGIRKIDAVVLSHADVDHFNATPGLLERFSIGGVYTSRAMFAEGLAEEPNSAPAALLNALRGSGTPLTFLDQGDRLTLGGVTAQVLHPLAPDRNSSDNANSLVLAIEFDGRSVLLPGDLEGPGLEEVLLQAPYDCDVLLAPHHGSSRSDPLGFADWSRPEWVAISGGPGADTQAAGRSYEQAGAEVLRTTEQGSIEFSMNAEGVSAETFLAP